jgi:hypothetical protein
MTEQDIINLKEIEISAIMKSDIPAPDKMKRIKYLEIRYENIITSARKLAEMADHSFFNL